MGELHLQTLWYQGAFEKIKKHENENSILRQNINKLKEGIRILLIGAIT